MEFSTNQKVAIVTGSSTGIGYETSITLATDDFLTYVESIISLFPNFFIIDKCFHLVLVAMKSFYYR